jgi:hypothetical protein
MALPSIHEIRIKGYKSLADETKLEIRPLTILAGANSSGKSSVMQPLLLLKQTLSSPSDPGVIELAGPNVQFNKYEQMFYHCPGKGKSAKEMKFGFSLGDQRKPDRLDVTYRLSDNSLRLDRQEITIQKDKKTAITMHLRPGRLTEEETNALPKPVRDFRLSVNKSRGASHIFKCQLARGFLDLVLAPENDTLMGFNALGFTPDRTIRQQLLNLIHIPGLREIPNGIIL